MFFEKRDIIQNMLTTNPLNTLWNFNVTVIVTILIHSEW